MFNIAPRILALPSRIFLFFLLALPLGVQAKETSRDNSQAGAPHSDPAQTARKRAAARLAASDPAGAIAACAGLVAAEDPDPACALISAAAHLQQQRWQAAAEVLEPARQGLGVLAPWGALLLGEARAGLGAHEEAIALLEEAAAADPAGPLGLRAEVPTALALAHAGKLPAATTRLQGLLQKKRGSAPALRLALARTLEAAGRQKDALQAYGELWRVHPASREARLAQARLEALAAAGVEIPSPTVDELLERTRGFLDAGHHRDALQTLDGIEAEGREPELALLRARALGGPGAHRQREAEVALAPSLTEEAPREIRAQALELASRLAMRRADVDEAIAFLRQLEKVGTANQAREAAFLSAFFLYDGGRFAEAEAAFADFAQRHPQGRRADEAVWYLAWNQYKQQKFQEAAHGLLVLQQRFPRSSLIDQAIYWRGRALEAAGDEKGARARYRENVQRDPTGWYALLAAARLGDEVEISAPAIARATLSSEPPALSKTARARFDRARALYDLGMIVAAGEELDAAIAGGKGRALHAAAATLARDGGDHHRAWQLGLFRLGGLRRAADLSWPEAFAEEVGAAASRFEVDPHFVWAIMRQESGFRPRVRSPAAAVGLMQILPSTAEKIAATLGRPAAEARALEDPRVNVTYGTWYLRALLDRFGQSPSLAAAAYNAGPEVVVRWMKEPARRDLPLDEFVESIPYRETRHYVKKVMANVQAYRLIYGGAPLRLKSELPPPAEGVTF